MTLRGQNGSLDWWWRPETRFNLGLRRMTLSPILNSLPLHLLRECRMFLCMVCSVASRAFNWVTFHSLFICSKAELNVCRSNSDSTESSCPRQSKPELISEDLNLDWPWEKAATFLLEKRGVRTPAQVCTIAVALTWFVLSSNSTSSADCNNSISLKSSSEKVKSSSLISFIEISTISSSGTKHWNTDLGSLFLYKRNGISLVVVLGGLLITSETKDRRTGQEEAWAFWDILCK